MFPQEITHFEGADDEQPNGVIRWRLYLSLRALPHDVKTAFRQLLPLPLVLA